MRYMHSLKTLQLLDSVNAQLATAKSIVSIGETQWTQDERQWFRRPAK